jgi:hypothetical protein
VNLAESVIEPQLFLYLVICWVTKAKDIVFRFILEYNS